MEGMNAPARRDTRAVAKSVKTSMNAQRITVAVTPRWPVSTLLDQESAVPVLLIGPELVTRNALILVLITMVAAMPLRPAQPEWVQLYAQSVLRAIVVTAELDAETSMNARTRMAVALLVPHARICLDPSNAVLVHLGTSETARSAQTLMNAKPTMVAVTLAPNARIHLAAEFAVNAPLVMTVMASSVQM